MQLPEEKINPSAALEMSLKDIKRLKRENLKLRAALDGKLKLKGLSFRGFKVQPEGV